MQILPIEIHANIVNIKVSMFGLVQNIFALALLWNSSNSNILFLFVSSLKFHDVVAKSQNNYLKYAIPAYEEQGLGVRANDE